MLAAKVATLCSASVLPLSGPLSSCTHDLPAGQQPSEGATVLQDQLTNGHTNGHNTGPFAKPQRSFWGTTTAKVQQSRTPLSKMASDKPWPQGERVPSKVPKKQNVWPKQNVPPKMPKKQNVPQNVNKVGQNQEGRQPTMANGWHTPPQQSRQLTSAKEQPTTRAKGHPTTKKHGGLSATKKQNVTPKQNHNVGQKRDQDDGVWVNQDPAAWPEKLLTAVQQNGLLTTSPQPSLSPETMQQNVTQNQSPGQYCDQDVEQNEQGRQPTKANGQFTTMQQNGWFTTTPQPSVSPKTMQQNGWFTTTPQPSVSPKTMQQNVTQNPSPWQYWNQDVGQNKQGSQPTKANGPFTTMQQNVTQNQNHNVEQSWNQDVGQNKQGSQPTKANGQLTTMQQNVQKNQSPWQCWNPDVGQNEQGIQPTMASRRFTTMQQDGGLTTTPQENRRLTTKQGPPEYEELKPALNAVLEEMPESDHYFTYSRDLPKCLAEIRELWSSYGTAIQEDVSNLMADTKLGEDYQKGLSWDTNVEEGKTLPECFLKPFEMAHLSCKEGCVRCSKMLVRKCLRDIDYCVYYANYAINGRWYIDALHLASLRRIVDLGVKALSDILNVRAGAFPAVKPGKAVKPSPMNSVRTVQRV